MAQGFVARAMKAGLAKLGEPSLLRGEDCGNVTIVRGFERAAGIASTDDDNYAAARDVATIDVAYDPRVNDVLEHPDGRFRLDRKIADNGHLRSFALVPA